MKKTFLLACTIGGAALAPALSADQIVFSDNFDGPPINTSLWTPSTPLPGGSVAEADGNLVLTNRGRMLTNAGFQSPDIINLAFEFTGNIHDSFKLVTRTDGTTTNPSGEFDSGIVASFRIETDPVDPTGANDNIELYDQNYPSGLTVLGYATVPLTLNQWYTVQLVETPTSVSLFLDDLTTPIISAVTASSYGDQIGIDNREGAAAGSSISEGSQVKVDYLTVTAVPDVASTALLLGSVLALLSVFRVPQAAWRARTYE